MSDSISQNTVRDLPPHISEDSIFDKPKLELSPELTAFSKPIFEDEIPEELSVGTYHSEEIPGLYALRHCNQVQGKARIIKAIELGFNYLCRLKLKQSVELSRTMLRKPRIFEAVLELETLFEEFRILHDFSEVKAATIKPDILFSLTKKLTCLREEASDYLLYQGKAIPKPPKWGKNNDPEEWYNINDFEILCACYRHEVEVFLKTVEGYFRKASRKEEEELGLHTPIEYSSKFSFDHPAPKKSKPVHFEEELSILPISSIASGGQIASIIEGSKQTTRIPWGNNKDNSENPFISDTRDKYIKPSLKIQTPPAEPPSDSSDSEPEENKPPIPPRSNHRPLPPTHDKAPARKSYHFDLRLKPETVPQWDGNSDTLARWILKINRLADKSEDVFEELGKVVPQRLIGKAETWYFSISEVNRTRFEENWGNLKKGIADYWMNHHWLEDQKMRANKARYREAGHDQESPSDYIIRKLELLKLVYSYTETETIKAIMSEVPDTWTSIINPQYTKTLLDFQNSVKYHEESLEKLGYPPKNRYVQNSSNREYSNSRYNFRKAQTNLVGWTNKLGPPPFPKDDKNISPRKPPDMVGARPCRHCGSGKHWDNECKFARKGEKLVRTNFAAGDVDSQAQEEYDELFYGLESDSEDLIEEQDFCSPLQRPDPTSHLASPSKELLTKEPNLKGTEGSIEPLGKTEVSVKEFKDIHSNKIATTPDKMLRLNRKNRRTLLKDLSRTYYSSVTGVSESNGSLVELKRFLSRPPGCSFLGSKATQVPVNINSAQGDPSSIIIDSGSDITLISLRTLHQLKVPSKMKIGQKINLVQVTGNASISGYVLLDLYFHTPEGPVKLGVEAYVVKGMSTPMILGNDFADQYGISVIRSEGNCSLEFGNSGRRMQVENSVSPPFTDEEGHTFRIKAFKNTEEGIKRNLHRKNQRVKRRMKFKMLDKSIRAAVDSIIPPETSSLIPVLANFPTGVNSLYVEKVFSTHRNENDIYAPPDSLISRNNPKIHVSNFSTSPVVISVGQVLGIGRNPGSWLSRMEKFSLEQQQEINNHGRLIQALVARRTPGIGLGSTLRNATVTSQARDLFPVNKLILSEEDPLSEPPLEGGPKTAEFNEDSVVSARLITELDINQELSSEQKKGIRDVVLRNQRAFGLDDKLGHLDVKVPIPLKPGSKEVSLPPFHASPASREIIDTQMDKWISQGVIEPSRSPWGAPAFIVY